MTPLPNANVNRVRIRLALDGFIGTMRNRGIDEAQLLPVVELVAANLGLADPDAVAAKVDSLYWEWKREPRQTLLEYVRTRR